MHKWPNIRRGDNSRDRRAVGNLSGKQAQIEATESQVSVRLAVVASSLPHASVTTFSSRVLYNIVTDAYWEAGR